MSEQHPPSNNLGGMAEELISDKRNELGSEAQARELYDVPTESNAELVEQQTEEEESPT